MSAGVKGKQGMDDALSILQDCDGNCFPVVENNSMFLSGSITRKVLCVAILHSHETGYENSERLEMLCHIY